MPRLPIDYANTVIYKIVCNDLSITECYVGHTTDFVRRKQGHKDRCKNERGDRYDLKIYKMIRDTGGWENYSMVEIEKYPCNDSNEACAKEREWYETLNCIMNTNFPQRSEEEWRKANKKEIELKMKLYAIKNKEIIVEYKKKYAEENRDQIAEYKKKHYEKNKEEIALKQKQYHQDNREEILIKQRQYVQDNKEEILERERLHRISHKEENSIRRSKRIICDCGIEINLDHKSRHLKTKVHNDNLNTLI